MEFYIIVFVFLKEGFPYVSVIWAENNESSKIVSENFSGMKQFFYVFKLVKSK